MEKILPCTHHSSVISQKAHGTGENREVGRGRGGYAGTQPVHSPFRRYVALELSAAGAKVIAATEGAVDAGREEEEPVAGGEAD